MANKVYGCPHCGAVTDFEQYDIIPGLAQIIRFDAKGNPEWSGETKVDWDGQIPDPKSPKKYHCISCDEDFDEPVLIEAAECQDQEK